MVGKVLQRQPIDQDVYTAALERVRRAYELFDHIAVSFSGGKDSTAVLNITLQVAHELDRLPLHVFFYDEEAIPYETEEYMRRVAERDDVRLDWYCLPIRCNNACTRSEAYWFPWAPEDRDKWVRPLPPEALTLEQVDWFPRAIKDRPPHYHTNPGLWPPSRYGNVGMMMGIRAAESLQRHRAVTRRRHDNYIIKENVSHGNVWKIYPIYDWSTQDVWTAPALHGWDYNRAYDVMEMAGIPHSGQRCSPPFGTEPLQKLHTYSVCFPDIWERMVDRVPGAAAAGRYATTELYGYGARPQKPDGMTWRDYIVSYLRQHGDPHHTVARIRDEIRQHFAHTSDPIAETARHPFTGLSWDHLVMLAMRGDPNDRKQASMTVRPQDYERNEKRYREQLEQIRAEGRWEEIQW